MDYAAAYRRALLPTVTFFGANRPPASTGISLSTKFAGDYSHAPMAKWFVGGQTNLCHNAVDGDVPARPYQPALIHVSTETGKEQVLSFGPVAR